MRQVCCYNTLCIVVYWRSAQSSALSFFGVDIILGYKEKMPFLHRVRGGVHAPHRKNTAEMPTEICPVPQEVCIVMQQHIGAPCVPCVKKGDEVYVGTKLGDSDLPVSAPIYSGVSGTVTDITESMLSNGSVSKAIIIKTDGKQTMADDITPPVISNKEEFLSAVRKSGLVGLGGAGFPAHIKLNPKTPVDTLVINGAECEPYITSDYREMIENTNDIISGIVLALKHLSFERAVIVVEDNKPKGIAMLKKAAEKSEFADKISVLPTKAMYPRGAEKVTVYAATGRIIKSGQLPADVGCVVMNVTSIATLARYAATGMPLVNKRITIDGSAVCTPKNMRVPIGTYIRDVINFAGGYKCEPKKLIMGGPMMGVALPSENMTVLKQTNAVLALDDNEAYPKPQSACIRCSRCLQVCPMSLSPTIIETHLKIKNTAALEKDGVMNCIECGCCAYECPAMRPLVQVMRESKRLVKESERKGGV